MKFMFKYVYLLILSIITSLILSSCYNTREIGVVSIKEVPNSKVKTGKEYLRVNIPLDHTTPKNPDIEGTANREIEYATKTINKVQISREVNDGTKAALVGFFIASFITPVIYTYASDNYMKKGEPWLYGGVFAIGVGAAEILIWFGLKAGEVKSYKNKPGPPKINYEINPISNDLITILPKNTSNQKSFHTNNIGQFRFNPINDFSMTYFDRNDPIIFNFEYAGRQFENDLKIEPSNWLYEFVEINKPLANIVSYDDKVIGTARLGLTYPVLSKSTSKSLYRVSFLDGKSGYLKFADVKSYYSEKEQINTSDAVKSYVEDQINKWLVQGEFESQEEYLKRMNTVSETVNNFTKEAIQLYQQDYINLIDWNGTEISKYDPNSQTFKISIPNLDEFIVHVPLSVAQKFKENWNNKQFLNQKFTLVDGKWKLASFDIKVSNVQYVANFNNDLTYNYNPVNQFNFDIPSISIVTGIDYSKADTSIAKYINYSINTNLPKTKMHNPNGVAVIIGNAQYKYVPPVKYALNDAQLMKTYLINVLGYQSSNVLYKPNITKAEMDGLFGSIENYKAQLYNYLPDDASADILIYYSGHGAPGLKDGKRYLMPVDCDSKLIEFQGYPVDLLFDNLTKLPAKSITVIFDACFSGEGIYKDISAIVAEVKDPIFSIPEGVFFTSSRSDQPATWLDQQKNGMFTYFFLKALHDYKKADINNDNKLSFQEIYEYVSDQSHGVPFYSKRLNGYPQNPTVKGNTTRIFVDYD